MEEPVPTAKQLLGGYNAAKDSVWVVESSIDRLTSETNDGEKLEIKGDIERNVGHLKIVVANQHMIDSGHDLTILQAAIDAGTACLESTTWPEPPEEEE